MSPAEAKVMSFSLTFMNTLYIFLGKYSNEERRSDVLGCSITRNLVIRVYFFSYDTEISVNCGGMSMELGLGDKPCLQNFDIGNLSKNIRLEDRRRWEDNAEVYIVEHIEITGGECNCRMMMANSRLSHYFVKILLCLLI
jgi:hypothetical protein